MATVARMSQRLDPSSTPGTQIRAYLLVEIDQALERVRSCVDVQVEDRPDLIRRIRKSTKRARAAASLLEPSACGRFRTGLRGCSRRLSDLRDRDVVRQTLEQLAENDDYLRDLLQGTLLEAILEVEGPEVSIEPDKANDGQDLFTSVQAELHSARAFASDLGPGELRWKFVIERVARSWRRARRAFRSEWSREDADSLHCARKAVIRLHAQLALVQRLDPEEIRTVRRGLRQLSRDLGYDRDVVLVLERAELVEGSEDLATARKRFMKRLQRDREEWLKEIRRQGKGLLEAHSDTIRAKMRQSIKDIRRASPV